MTRDALSEEVIRLWPEGPPTKLEGVGPEVTFRGWSRRRNGNAAQCVGADADRVPSDEWEAERHRPDRASGRRLAHPGVGTRGIDVAKWAAAQGTPHSC